MEERVSNIILGTAGPCERFTLKYGLFRFRLQIRPLTARQVIEISAASSRLGDLDIDNGLFPGLLKGGPGLKDIADIIAIATNTRYRGIVSRGILKLNLKDILTLFKVVIRQSDPEQFFFIMALTKGTNKLKSSQTEQ